MADMKTITLNGITYRQIQKRTAHKAYNNGVMVFIIPCKANVNSAWIQFSELNVDRLENQNFDVVVNQYEYYNCNSELGTYSHFYIIA